MVGNSNDNSNFPHELLLTKLTLNLTLNYQKLNYQR